MSRFSFTNGHNKIRCWRFIHKLLRWLTKKTDKKSAWQRYQILMIMMIESEIWTAKWTTTDETFFFLIHNSLLQFWMIELSQTVCLPENISHLKFQINRWKITKFFKLSIVEEFRESPAATFFASNHFMWAHINELFHVKDRHYAKAFNFYHNEFSSC